MVAGGTVVSSMGSTGPGQVVEVGDAAHGDGDALAFEPAVAQDLPGLHPREGVFDAGAGAPVGGVVFGLPMREFAAGAASMRDDGRGRQVPAVGDYVMAAASGLGAGLAEGFAVVTVAGGFTCVL